MAFVMHVDNVGALTVGQNLEYTVENKAADVGTNLGKDSRLTT